MKEIKIQHGKINYDLRDLTLTYPADSVEMQEMKELFAAGRSHELVRVSGINGTVTVGMGAGIWTFRVTKAVERR